MATFAWTDVSALPLAYLDLATPHVADAAMRLGIEVRQAPTNLVPLWEDCRLAGRVRPARHYGSVDVFLEALEAAEPGEVLVVDNGGRDDEACVGDLAALEVQRAGLNGIVIWGLHRDTRELRTIRLPVFSQGSLAAGPAQIDRRPADALVSARVGSCTVTAKDFVLADEDGVLFLPLDRAADVAVEATAIRETERRQAARMRLGTSLREQTQFGRYLQSRERDDITFRQHLRTIDATVEV